MKTGTFDRLLRLLASLSARQREKLGKALSQVGQENEAIGCLQGQFEADPQCPRCQHAEVYRHGHANGLQRYRCRGCSRTFNVLTGTPLARLRLKGKWLLYLQQMLESLTVRRAAQATGVHRNTSFRWRHRFLMLAKDDRPAHLHGIAEADETYFHESSKGSRHLDRPPRKRAEAAKQRGTSTEQICVLVARDRTGQTVDFVTGKGPVSKAQLNDCLAPVLDTDILLVTDGSASYRYFAKDNHVTHQYINLRTGVRVRGAIHIQNVNAYHQRLRGWIARFHGVATHYLPNYLGWRRALDTRRLPTPKALLLAATGVFPQVTVT